MDQNEWTRAVFDHPVADPEWYFSDDAQIPYEHEEQLAIENLIKTLENAQGLLDGYSPAQVAQGLNFLVSLAGGDYVGACLRGPAVFEQKERLHSSIEKCFLELFAPRVDFNEDLQQVCQMWWDLDCLYMDNGAELDPRVRQEHLAVLDRLLRAPSRSVKYAAVHGLAHWLRHGSSEAKDSLERFKLSLDESDLMMGYVDESLAGKGI